MTFFIVLTSKINCTSCCTDFGSEQDTLPSPASGKESSSSYKETNKSYFH